MTDIAPWAPKSFRESRRYARWTREEDAMLIAALAKGLHIKRIAAEVDRPPRSVEGRMRYLGLTRYRSPASPASPAALRRPCLSFRIRPSTADALLREAQRLGLPRTRLLGQIIEAWLRQQQQESPRQ